MPLNPADPAYLSFEKTVLPVAVERGIGIQAMKSTANSGLLADLHLRDCLTYVLSLPVHCLALGSTTIGQIEDDVRIAQQFHPMPEAQMAEICPIGRATAGELEARPERESLRAPVPGWRAGLTLDRWRVSLREPAFGRSKKSRCVGAHRQPLPCVRPGPVGSRPSPFPAPF